MTAAGFEKLTCALSDKPQSTLGLSGWCYSASPIRVQICSDLAIGGGSHTGRRGWFSCNRHWGITEFCPVKLVLFVTDPTASADLHGHTLHFHYQLNQPMKMGSWYFINAILGIIKVAQIINWRKSTFYS